MSRALATSRDRSGSLQPRVEDDAQRLAVEAGQPDGQRRIVGERRFDPDHDRLVRRAHHLDAQIGDLPGDPEARVVGVAGGVAVGGLGELQRDARAAPPSRAGYGRDGRAAPALLPSPTVTSIPAARSRAWPCPRTSRIRVLDRRDDPRYAGLRRSPRRRAATCLDASTVRASHRASRRAAASPASSMAIALGMRASARRGHAASDDDSVLHAGSRRRRGWARPGPATARRE